MRLLTSSPTMFGPPAAFRGGPLRQAGYIPRRYADHKLRIGPWAGMALGGVPSLGRVPVADRRLDRRLRALTEIRPPQRHGGGLFRAPDSRVPQRPYGPVAHQRGRLPDRKSTRLNSSHLCNTY